MTPRIEILANVIRLTTAGFLLVAQSALLYSLSIVRVRGTQHRRDCPFARPYWRQDVVVPDPADCPHCVWLRIYAFNFRYAVVGWVILVVALLSLVAFAAVDP